MADENRSSLWQVRVDTGGTFTDCLAVDPSGHIHRAKVLSNSALRGVVVAQEAPDRLRVRENWNAPPDFVRGLKLALLDGAQSAILVAYDPTTGIVTLSGSLTAAPGAAFEIGFPFEAPVLAARLVTRTPPDAPLPPLDLRVATTRGTNALLTRQGMPPALFVTTGFGDLLEIGTQQRPDLFALDIVKPGPLYGAVVEVSERLNADGSVLRPLDEAFVAREAVRLSASGIHTAAVALLHSDLNAEHERRIADLLRRAGFTHVSLSSDLAPFIKILPRAQTAVVNAYLAPVIDGYVGGIARELAPDSTLHGMTSAGGLVRRENFHAKDSLLSGPAGGIVGAAAAARAAGFDRILAFDMGGTSTDVARYDGDFEYVWEHGVGDAHLVAPALAIESVAAGGGSICRADRHGLYVGPQSAGAFPGPACYGAGGPLTITDVNLLLGRLSPERFEIPLSRDRAEQAAGVFFADANVADAPEAERDDLLEGLLEIANERMADAIRRVSLRRGYDPAGYALVAFGGAGGQHGCAVARRLGVRHVIVPPDASLLSAWGLGEAAIERFAERQVLRPLDAAMENEAARIFAQLAGDAADALVAGQASPRESLVVRRRMATLRLAGQESALTVEYGGNESLAKTFARRYQSVYGYAPDSGQRVEVVSLRVVVASVPAQQIPSGDSAPVPQSEDASPTGTARARFEGEWRETPVFERSGLGTGALIAGPALIAERHSVTVVEPGWTATVHPAGALVLADSGDAAGKGATMRHDAVEQELAGHRFATIAEEMGEVLLRTALSTNVKERLDYSCALLDAEGRLVANAAHIPVHLGALGVCVRALRAAIPMEPGDVVVTNHPAFGGSHLPDVTVVTPVFAGTTLIGYAASRAHHAEIGGTRPGSMPPDATTLAEEGVVIRPTYVVRRNISRLDEICRLLSDAPYPSRRVSDNRADLEAAIAANRRGADALLALAENTPGGPAGVARRMGALQLRAERLLRDTLARMPDGDYHAVERLDDGSPISARFTIRGGTATIDFAGTAPTHPGNLNATPAIAISAVLYALRLLVREDLPLNEGLLRPITLVFPPDSLLNPPFDATDPAKCPAVVGGNTETSQRVVDTLLRALNLAACSQGTMNNVLWGTPAFGYYETVCGGAGATSGAPGAHAVHTHMTNTRITDVEILERRYPVRIDRFAIRRGSGGAGQHRGGEGVVRETVFLAPMALSVLTQHRTFGPYGLDGGKAGLAGRQRVIHAGGHATTLSSVDGCEVEPGDSLILETPGGGGWGSLDPA